MGSLNEHISGAFMFASSTFLISMYNLNTRGVHTPNVIVGMAIFGGGLIQILAGTWEFARGNVFGATSEASLLRGHALILLIFLTSPCRLLLIRCLLDVLLSHCHPWIWCSPSLFHWSRISQCIWNVSHGVVHGYGDVDVCALPFI